MPVSWSYCVPERPRNAAASPISEVSPCFTFFKSNLCRFSSCFKNVFGVMISLLPGTICAGKFYYRSAMQHISWWERPPMQKTKSLGLSRRAFPTTVACVSAPFASFFSLFLSTFCYGASTKGYLFSSSSSACICFNSRHIAGSLLKISNSLKALCR